jgi:L-alanine-DL-glutamate epimerase-like enolase superfamily enzyme
VSRIRRIEGRAVATVGPDFSYTAALPPPYNTTTIVRIVDDEGEEGYGAHDADSFGDFETTSLERVRQAAPFLVGTEAWARAPIGELISGAGTSPVPPGALSAIDIAMWDLAAVRAGVPLWQLLGGAQADLAAYASLPFVPETSQYLETVAQACADRFTAVKLHVSGDPVADVALCEAVRDAHAGLDILADAEGIYDRRGARYVSEALGDLDVRWLEAPLPDNDLTGYRELRARSRVPILAAGDGVWDVRSIGAALAGGAPWDAIRTDICYAGGITYATRLCGIARAFSMDVELTSYGHTLVQAANLHAMLGLGGASYFEMAYPSEPWNLGVDEAYVLDADGRVRAHDAPGLGITMDQDAINAATIAEFSCEDS